MKEKTISGFPDYTIKEDGTITIKAKLAYVTSKLGKKVTRNLKPREITFKGTRANVRLTNDEKTGFASVANLVAEHFLPNPDNAKKIRYKDGNPHNRHVSNLKWAVKDPDTPDPYKKLNNKYKEAKKLISSVVEAYDNKNLYSFVNENIDKLRLIL